MSLPEIVRIKLLTDEELIAEVVATGQALHPGPGDYNHIAILTTLISEANYRGLWGFPLMIIDDRRLPDSSLDE